ncbi:putative transglycosylase-associated protein [Bdellovibrio bacteriovorus W]|nr:putative transglycosylase-associated protein [Bdellovibrio bacteriovorus W]
MIWTIVIGFVIGVVAKFLMPGSQGGGIILTTILGIVGSVVGTYIGSALGLYQMGESAGFIASVLGAMLLLFIVGMIQKRA